MADIFVSYSSKHRDLTRELATFLMAQGYSVWWDTELEAYASFRDQIDAALSEARVVVVIWSDGAVASDYVVAEAREALTKGGVGNQGRLVNTIAPGFDPTRIPKPMSEYQAERVDDADAVARAIAKRWSGEKPARLNAADHYELATGKPALSPKRDVLTAVAHVTPALLLNARVALAPYLDVHGLRAGLSVWAREGRAVRGKLIHGPGGLGKTRLMVEVCADMRAQGWAAGFIETPDTRDADIHRQAIEGLIDSDRTPGLLLVLDYGERRQEEAARYAELMLGAAQHRPNRPLRIALLARAAGEWWDRAVAEASALSAVFADDKTQMATFSDVDARARLFDKACAGFREAIAKAREADPGAFRSWNLSDQTMPDLLRGQMSGEAFARPLMIQIAALIHLQGETPDATSTTALLDGMLGLERNYWKRALGAAHTDQRRTALARGTVQTTLVGGAGKRDAEALLLKDSYFARNSPADVAEPLSDLERIYGDGLGKLIPLEPDLVGEHLVVAEEDQQNRLIDACLDWAGNDSIKRRAILTVLQRATRTEHGTKAARAHEALEHVVKSRTKTHAIDLISVALETPGALPQIIARAGTLSEFFPSNTPISGQAETVFTSYVNAILKSNNSEIAALLIAVMHEMIMDLYVESGLLEPLSDGSARFRLTHSVTNGGAVARAFEIARVMCSAVLAFWNGRLLKSSESATKFAVSYLLRQAYYAGGFGSAGWGAHISGYFEDAGHGLYYRLHEIASTLSGSAPISPVSTFDKVSATSSAPATGLPQKAAAIETEAEPHASDGNASLAASSVKSQEFTEMPLPASYETKPRRHGGRVGLLLFVLFLLAALVGGGLLIVR